MNVNALENLSGDENCTFPELNLTYYPMKTLSANTETLNNTSVNSLGYRHF